MGILEDMMTALEQIQQRLDRMETAFAGIAADIVALKGGVNPDGLTAEEAQALIARLDTIAQNLEGLDAQTES